MASGDGIVAKDVVKYGLRYIFKNYCFYNIRMFTTKIPVPQTHRRIPADMAGQVKAIICKQSSDH